MFVLKDCRKSENGDRAEKKNISKNQIVLKEQK